MLDVIVWNGMDIVGLIIFGIGIILFLGGLAFIKIGGWIEDCKRGKKLKEESYKKAKEMRGEK